MNHLVTTLSQPLHTALQWALSRDKGLLAMNASLDNLTAIYPYHDHTGKEIFIKARFDKDGKKWIKPFHYDGKCYKIGEPKHLDTKPLYTPAPLSDVAYIVEGEKCVHFMLDIGLCAVTTGGSTSVDKCDLTPLQGRKCVLWRDNDTAGEKWQSELITALNRLKIAYEVVDIAGVMLPTGESLPVKGDCVDFIESHLKDGNDYAGVKSLIERLPRLDGNAINNAGSDDPKAILGQRKSNYKPPLMSLPALTLWSWIYRLGRLPVNLAYPKRKY